MYADHVSGLCAAARVSADAEREVSASLRRARSSRRDWLSWRFEGGRSGPAIRMSRSVGVMYWVPETHWKFEIVGRGGIRRLGLKILSWERQLCYISMFPKSLGCCDLLGIPCAPDVEHS